MPMHRVGDRVIYEPSCEARQAGAAFCSIMAKICFAIALICVLMGW